MSGTKQFRILERAVQHVLQTMCFSDAEAASGDLEEDARVSATIAFEGGVAGHLRIEIAPQSAMWLTASFLGTEEQNVGAGAAADTVGELSNMICGRFLSLLNPSAKSRIEPPRVTTGAREMSADRASCEVNSQTFRIEPGLLRVAVYWRSQSSPASR